MEGQRNTWFLQVQDDKANVDIIYGLCLITTKIFYVSSIYFMIITYFNMRRLISIIYNNYQE
jgi:hypothetical protein